MCGIVCRIDPRKSVNKQVIADYRFQIRRGKEGFGFMTTSKEGNVTFRRFTQEKEAIRSLKQMPSKMVLFHHRKPTSTPNIKSSCHPFVVTVKGTTYAVLHNGIITNAKERFVIHKQSNIRYTSHIKKDKEIKFNDSEVLAIDMAHALSDRQEGVLSRGNIAVVVAEIKHNRLVALHWGKNYGSPLKHFVSLEGHVAIRSETSETWYKSTTENQLHTYRFDTKKYTYRPFDFPSTYYKFKNYYRKNESQIKLPFVGHLTYPGIWRIAPTVMPWDLGQQEIINEVKFGMRMVETYVNLSTPNTWQTTVYESWCNWLPLATSTLQHVFSMPDWEISLIQV